MSAITKEFILKDRKTVLQSMFVLVTKQGLKEGDQFITDLWKDGNSGLPILLTVKRFFQDRISVEGMGSFYFDVCLTFIDKDEKY